MTITITVTETIYDVPDLLKMLTELRDLAQSRNQRALVMSVSFDEGKQLFEIRVELREPDPDWFGEQSQKQAV